MEGRRAEKVDYAIFKNNIPIMFIEAKAVGEELVRHSAQLERYFNATPEVRVAIITNGIEYKFFTDLDKNNIMDENPFFRVDKKAGSLALGFKVDQAPKGHGESRIFIESPDDLVQLKDLVIECFDQIIQ